MSTLNRNKKQVSSQLDFIDPNKPTKVLLVDNEIAKAMIEYFLKYDGDGQQILQNNNISIKIIKENFFSIEPNNDKFNSEFKTKDVNLNWDLLQISKDQNPPKNIQYISLLSSNYKDKQELLFHLFQHKNKSDKVFSIESPAPGNRDFLISLFTNEDSLKRREFIPEQKQIAENVIKKTFFEKSNDYWNEINNDKEISEYFTKYILENDDVLTGKDKILSNEELSHFKDLKNLLLLDLINVNNKVKAIDKKYQMFDLNALVDVKDTPNVKVKYVSTSKFHKYLDSFKECLEDWRVNSTKEEPTQIHPLLFLYFAEFSLPNEIPIGGKNYRIVNFGAPQMQVFEKETNTWRDIEKNEYPKINNLDMNIIYRVFEYKLQGIINSVVSAELYVPKIIEQTPVRNPKCFLYTKNTFLEYCDNNILKKYKNIFPQLSSTQTIENFLELFHSFGWISNPNTFSSDLPKDILDTNSCFYNLISNTLKIPKNIIPTEDYETISKTDSSGIYPLVPITNYDDFISFLKKEWIKNSLIMQEYIVKHKEQWLDSFKKEYNITKNITIEDAKNSPHWEKFAAKRFLKEAPKLVNKQNFLQNIMKDKEQSPFVFDILKSITDQTRSAVLNAQNIKKVKVSLTNDFQKDEFILETAVPGSEKIDKLKIQDIFPNLSVNFNKDSTTTIKCFLKPFPRTDINSFIKHSDFQPAYTKDEIASNFNELFCDNINSGFDDFNKRIAKLRDLGLISTTKSHDSKVSTRGYQLTTQGKRVLSIYTNFIEKILKTKDILSIIENNVSYGKEAKDSFDVNGKIYDLQLSYFLDKKDSKLHLNDTIIDFPINNINDFESLFKKLTIYSPFCFSHYLGSLLNITDFNNTKDSELPVICKNLYNRMSEALTFNKNKKAFFKVINPTSKTKPKILKKQGVFKKLDIVKNNAFEVLQSQFNPNETFILNGVYFCYNDNDEFFKYNNQKEIWEPIVLQQIMPYFDAQQKINNHTQPNLEQEEELRYQRAGVKIK